MPNQSYNQGIADAANILLARAAELRAIGNFTADTMARIFEDQAEAILSLKTIR